MTQPRLPASGLDNAGKTTLLHKMRTSQVALFPPTQRAHLETFVVGDISFTAWDLGGHEAVRQLWKKYVSTCDSVLFMVDAADSSRFQEAAKELAMLIEGMPCHKPPMAVLLNKSDLLVSKLHVLSSRVSQSAPPVFQ